MKDILLNLLFILVLLFITQLFLDTRTRKFKNQYRAAIIYLSSMISVIFCMNFSITVDEQFRYDLRAIPLILGGLFGGPVVSAGLYISLLFYRLMLGFDSGFWGNVLNYGFMTILLIFFSRGFVHLSTKQRLSRLSIIILSHVVFSYLIYYYILISRLPMSIFWETSLIKIAFSALIVTFAEGMFRHHKVRDQLEVMEKMQLVSHLSASISHEVRNGLTSAHGFFQLLREKETDPQKLRYIGLALDELNRTENIIRDFLTFSKPTPKEIKNHRLDQLINNSLELISPLANMHSIKIKKTIIPFSFKCDESLIQQALINIFKNAIEVMPNGGVLEVHLISKQHETILVIKDTGIGMTQEQMDRIGTPYYTTKGQKGTGLGMMVAYRVIQGLNGNIKVFSQVGKGTTFIIHLPRAL